MSITKGARATHRPALSPPLNAVSHSLSSHPLHGPPQTLEPAAHAVGSRGRRHDGTHAPQSHTCPRCARERSQRAACKCPPQLCLCTSITATSHNVVWCECRMRSGSKRSSRSHVAARSRAARTRRPGGPPPSETPRLDPHNEAYERHPRRHPRPRIVRREGGSCPRRTTRLHLSLT